MTARRKRSAGALGMVLWTVAFLADARHYGASATGVSIGLLIAAAWIVSYEAWRLGRADLRDERFISRPMRSAGVRWHR
jgi:hypothetical protein